MSKRLPGHRGEERLQEHLDEDIGDPLEDFIEREERKYDDRTPWKCQACGYTVNVGDEESNCQNCGRDPLGRQGVRPIRDEREARAGLRDDIAQGFTDFTP